MAITASPLRYPGGKSALTSFLAAVLERNSLLGETYVEPFAGGAGAGLNLLLGGYVSNLIINDSDSAIYAFWWSVLNRTDDFLQKVNDVSVTLEEWKIQKNVFLNREDHSIEELGFAAFFLNRCNRSGILRANPIGGIKQTGKWLIDARFNREGLSRRIAAVAKRRSDIVVKCKDAIDFLREDISAVSGSSFVYLDPPYYNYGQELYLNAYRHDDHARLARFMCSETGLSWVMTYDDHDSIRDMYAPCRITEFSLNYFAHNKRKGRELLISPPHLVLPDEKIMPRYGTVKPRASVSCAL